MSDGLCHKLFNQKLTFLVVRLIKKLDWCVSDNKSLEEIYHH